LGFSIVGGYSSPHGNLPIYVKTVFDKGAACNKLKRGDQIITVDKFKLDGMTHQEVVKILKQTGDIVTLSILT
jgi:C-terminal processing protease CtpA/Prc